MLLRSCGHQLVMLHMNERVLFTHGVELASVVSGISMYAITDPVASPASMKKADNVPLKIRANKNYIIIYCDFCIE